ncbi:MAG: hypothetical protein ACRC2R_04820 [Xenococcaceae cyanobacterium]
MSEFRWSGLVYGRSYQVDFSSIATPCDFTAQDTQWALQYITATTKSADKLAGNPRWSLFKNEKYCVVGVTCMVKDLLGDGDDMIKDCQGRPLYIFVGYVAPLKDKTYLRNVPTYSSNNLELFAPLYQHVRDIWYLKEYEKFDKLPILTKERELVYSEFPHTVNYDLNLARQLNHQQKDRDGDRVFLWQDSDEYRKKLWVTAARCQFSISLCLGFKSEFDALSSPFLNGTARSIESPRAFDKTTKSTATKNERSPSLHGDGAFFGARIPRSPAPLQSLPNLVRDKVKDDIKVTIAHVEKAVEVGQDLVQSLTTKTEFNSHHQSESNSSEFGFKTKKAAPTTESTNKTESTESWF